MTYAGYNSGVKDCKKEIIKKIKKMKNSNEFSTPCYCDQCGNNRTNAVLDDIIKLIKGK